MTMPCTRLAAMALATTIFATAGCGGSSTKGPSSGSSAQGSASGGAKPLTRSELIAQGDAICRHLNKQAATIVTNSLHSVGTSATPLAGFYRAASIELSKLTPPTQMAAPWGAIVSEVQRAPSIIVRMGRFALANDASLTAKTEFKLKVLQERRTTLARHNGFTDCGEI